METNILYAVILLLEVIILIIALIYLLSERVRRLSLILDLQNLNLNKQQRRNVIDLIDQYMNENKEKKKQK